MREEILFRFAIISCAYDTRAILFYNFILVTLDIVIIFCYLIFIEIFLQCVGFETVESSSKEYWIGIEKWSWAASTSARCANSRVVFTARLVSASKSTVGHRFVVHSLKIAQVQVRCCWFYVFWVPFVFLVFSTFREIPIENDQVATSRLD